MSSSSSEDEKWASIAQIKEVVEDDGDDDNEDSCENGVDHSGEEEGTTGASFAGTSTIKSEDNHNQDLHNNNPTTTISNGRIHLKAIPQSEMESLNQLRQQQRRRSRKSARFVTDAQSTLSAEQMKSQMNDTTDTMTKDGVAEVLKVGKVSDKFEKLVKTPERTLSSRLEQYFSRSPRKVPPTFNDFEISIDELQAEVDQLVALRKHRQNPAKYPRLKAAGTSRNGSGHLDSDVDYASFSFSDFKRKAVKSVTAPLNSSNSTSNTVTVQLGKIDGNFRPTVSLGTRTYTRTRTKDLPVPQKESVAVVEQQQQAATTN